MLDLLCHNKAGMTLPQLDPVAAKIVAAKHVHMTKRYLELMYPDGTGKLEPEVELGKFETYNGHGMIRASSIPPSAIRDPRVPTRRLRQLIGDAASKRNRVRKVLEEADFKPGNVVSDIFGVSGGAAGRNRWARTTLPQAPKLNMSIIRNEPQRDPGKMKFPNEPGKSLQTQQLPGTPPGVISRITESGKYLLAESA
jgi:hypothetical protein